MGEATSVNACFADPDGDVLAYSVVSSDVDVATAAASGSTIRLVGVAPGTALITVTATDETGLEGKLTLRLTVPNRAPVAVGRIPGRRMLEGGSGSVDVSGYFTDPDGQQLRYAVSSSDTSIATVAGAGSVFTVGARAAGTASVTVTAMDPGGLTASQNFGVIVREPLARGPQACREGSAGGFPCEGVDLVSRLGREEMEATIGIVNDIWGWTDPATGTEWALVGHSSGTSFVSLEDPAKPVYAGILPLTDGATASLWRDIKVYRNYAFVVADRARRHGMQVFDLTQLRDVENPPQTFSSTTTYDRIHSAHNIVINEETGFAYSVGGYGGADTCGGGLHMIDISTPSDPRFAGCFADESTGTRRTGYTHDAICVVYRGPDTEHQGSEVCFGSNETSLSIADVSDKANPVALVSVSYPDVAYTHQGWLDEAQEYLYMNDELDEFNSQPNTRTLVWDVRDLDDPIIVTEFLHTTTASDHNLYVVGDFMYQSNYAEGLRILSIADRENPVELGFFDTDPDASDSPGLDGSWSNYPFFASGVIPVTSMGGGVLFVKRSN